MVVSKQRWAFGVTRFTPTADLQEKVEVVGSIGVATSPNTAMLRINLASHHYLLGLVVEGDLLAGLDGGDVHTQRDGMTISSLDGRIGSFAGTDALHPVAHVGRGLWVAVGVSIGRDGLCLLDERKAGQQGAPQSHLGGRTSGQATSGSHRLFVHVDHAAVGVVKLLDAAGAVCESRGV